jgi:hypothetical protein
MMYEYERLVGPVNFFHGFLLLGGVREECLLPLTPEKL